VIAGRDGGDGGTHRFHDPGALVAEHDGRRVRDGAIEDAHVAVAQAGVDHAHQHFVAPGIADEDIVAQLQP
jgi:hypothetical protein